MSHTADKDGDLYHVVLTQREAEVILGVLRSVGGNPTGPRGVANSVAQELIEQGLDTFVDRFVGVKNQGGSGMYFPDTWADVYIGHISRDNSPNFHSMKKGKS